MSDITLQLAYDSSFIDFVLEKNENGEITSIDLKLSLLSNGNSFSKGSTIDESNFNDLRSLLLPWNWKEQPKSIRIYKIIRDVPLEDSKSIDIPISVFNTDIEEEDKNIQINENKIKNYFELSLLNQVSNIEDMKLAMTYTGAKDINVEEDYESTNKLTEDKSQVVIAQMAQKLYPYNQNLSFLYLSTNIVDDDVALGFFNIKDIELDTLFVCFPITNDDSSIWYPKYKSLKLENDNYFIEYHRWETPADIDLKCNAYTKATPYPVSNYPQLQPSTNDGEPIIHIEDIVTLRKDGKFDGSVKIEVGQDNNWKVGFVDVLVNLLDIRDFLFRQDTKKTIANNTVDLQSNISIIKSYLFSPFYFIYDYIDSIEQIYLKGQIISSDTIQSDSALLLREVTNLFTDIRNNLKLYHEQETEKERLIDLILERIPYYHNESEYLDYPSLEGICRIYSKLSDISVQLKLVLLLCRMPYENLKLIKQSTNTIQYEFEFNENNIILLKREKFNGNIVEEDIDQCKTINFHTLNIYQEYHTFIIHNAYHNDESLLKHLVKDIRKFGANEVNQFVPTVIETVYDTDEVPLFKFPKGGNETYHYTLTGLKETLISYLESELISLTKPPQQPSSEQLPIRIQIGTPAQLAPKNDTESDDLADELSGYVLLSTRSKEMNENNKYEDWKYHNWSKIKLSSEENLLNNPFLVPSYLPEQNGVQQIFLEISNESASLIANLEGLNKIAKEDIEESNIPKIEYLLPSDNKSQNPYALRYGYYYNFAAFAVLNSGVLPEPLRDGDTLNKFKENVGFSNINPSGNSFHYLRTKAVSPPNVSTNARNYAKEYGGKLNPLYFELYDDEIKKEEEAGEKGKELILKGHKFNESIEMTITKPMTSFWDCFSFVGLDELDQYKCQIRMDKNDKELTNDFIDPSVADKFIIEIYNKKTKEIIDSGLFEYEKIDSLDFKTAIPAIQNFKLNLSNKTKIEDFNIYFRDGGIYELRVSNLVYKKYFDANNLERKFDKTYFISRLEDYDEDFYKISANTIVFETAFVREEADRNKNLWKNISLREILLNDKNKELTVTEYNQYKISNSVKLLLNSSQYEGYSRVKVQHQKLDWQGRQPNVDLKELAKPDELNPSEKDKLHDTTESMKLDAWWNSERPNDTSVTSYSKVLASKNEVENLLHEYKNVLDNHAMLLKYSLTLYNRYEALGEPYSKDFITSEIKIDDKKGTNINGTFYPWKFYLKKSKRVEQLPTPSVRFYIPLTGSIKEANDFPNLDIADVMLVLDDVWYREAGLAQKFKLGIQLSQDFLSNEDKLLPEAGFDVTISEAKTKYYEIKQENKKNDFIEVDDKHFTGPLGFTFDFVATNPKVNSTSFIISGNGLASYIGEDYKEKNDALYPMFKLAVRSEVLKELHSDENIKNNLNSKWSGTQWVQFLKAVDSFVPASWRSEVRRNGYFEVAKNKIEKMLKLEMFSLFGETFNNFHNWYLIFSSVESNIGGLPIERYYDTYLLTDSEENNLQSVHNTFSLQKFEEGYVRIMVVRKSDDYKEGEETIWDQLFGKKENENNREDKNNRIKKDNTLAMPIITERIPIKLT